MIPEAARQPARRRRRLLWLIPASLGILYAIVAVFLGSAVGKAMPHVVLSVYPHHAPSLVNSATIALTGGKGKDSLDDARRYAQAAIAATSVPPDALRTIALIDQVRGNENRATRALLASQRLTRRDLATTLLLVEKFILRNDIPATLREYDFALRTSRQASALLFPNLIAAVDNEWVRPELAEALAREPEWGDGFAAQLIEADVMPRNKVMLANRLRGARWFGTPFRNALTSRLVRDGQFTLAAEMGGEKRGYNPGLRQALSLAPGSPVFGWKLANGYAVETIIAVDGSDAKLTVSMEPEFRDAPARLLVMLPPGRYRLSSALARPLEGDVEVAWTIRCATKSGTELARLTLAASAAEAVFSVPSGCAGQWVALAVSPGPSASGDVSAEIGSLSIAPYEEEQGRDGVS